MSDAPEVFDHNPALQSLVERVQQARATRGTLCIRGGIDHAQVSAPGYGMYYLWVVRHLPRRPYKGFTFTAEHRWLLDPAQQGWQPTLPTP